MLTEITKKKLEFDMICEDKDDTYKGLIKDLN